MEVPGENSLHMYSGGPIEAAFRWFSSIVGTPADLRRAWELTGSDLRLALAQGWLVATDQDGAGADERAQAIAAGAPGPLWDQFEEWRLTRWRTLTWPDCLDDNFGTYNQPEFATPELCFVRFVPGARVSGPAPQVLVVVTFTVRYTGDQWLVAGIGRRLPLPGWPPTEVEVASDSVPPS